MKKYGIPDLDVIADGGRCLGEPGSLRDRDWWCRLRMHGATPVLRFGSSAADAVWSAADELERQGRHEIDDETRGAIAHGVRLGLLGQLSTDAEAI